MPRLATSLLKRAKGIHPFLPLILRATRDLDLARSELRWLAEYQSKLEPRAVQQVGGRRAEILRPPTLRELCVERSRGRPLQYILGTQPFGDLEILCRKGVFIPRSTTEQYVERLANILTAKRPRGTAVPSLIKILDPCAGTGCIALSLYAKLRKMYHVKVTAVDVSEHAIALAKRNLQHNIANGLLPKKAAEHIHFVHGDILNLHFRRSLQSESGTFNLAVLNAPYMTGQELQTTAERSVRLFEPRSALVGDQARFENVVITMLDKRCAVLVSENVYERAARRFVSRRVAEQIHRYTDEAWSDEGNRTYETSIHLWRDNSMGANALAGPSSHKIQIQSGDYSTGITMDRNGPVNATVDVWGSWNLLFEKSQGHHAPNGSESAATDTKKGSGAVLSKAPAPQKPVVIRRLKSSSPSTPENGNNIVASLTESVCEALDSVRTLTEEVQRQRETNEMLLQEQASLWDVVKTLAKQKKELEGDRCIERFVHR